MTAEIIDDEAGLLAMVPEWRALWRASGAGPFQSPEWLMPWWAAFGTGRPLVVVAREGGAVRGVFPAYVLGEGAEAKVLPMGAGTTDYLDVLGGGAEALLHALLRRASEEGVRRLDLMDVPPDAGLRGATARAGWRGVWHEGEACPVLRVADVPPGIRRKLRMNRNRAERAGGWSVRAATAATLEGDFGTLVALHGGRWAGDGEPGVLIDPAVLRFHRLAAPGLLAAGMMRLCVLEVGAVPAAAIMALLGPGRIYFYLSGYDRAQAFVSPGTLLLGAMLEQAESEGRGEAHLLRGREGYKYAWGAVDRLNAGCGFVAEGAGSGRNGLGF